MEENKAGSAYERKYAKAMEEGKRLRKAYRPRADIRRYLSSTFRLKADDLDGIMSTLYESATKSAVRVKESLEGILDNSAKFRYMMLSRFVEDAKYYLAHEDRSERVLWSGNAVEHADNMVKLYDSFSEDEKPEWLTKPELDNYVKELYASVGKQSSRVREGIVSTKDGEKTFDELYGKGIALTEEDEAYAKQFARCFESANETRPNRLREASRPFMGYTDQKLSYLLSHYQQRNSEWDANEADRRLYATQIRRLQAEIDLRAARRKEKADAQFSRCFESTKDTRKNRIRKGRSRLDVAKVADLTHGSNWLASLAIDLFNGDMASSDLQYEPLQGNDREIVLDALSELWRSSSLYETKIGKGRARLMESLADMPDWMEGALKGFIRENYRFKEAEGHFYGSIDPDYRDELDKKSIQRILKAENPMEEFDSIIDRVSWAWFDEGDFGLLDDEYNSLMVDMMRRFDDWAKGEGFDAEGSFESWEQDIEQWVRENVSFSLNTSQYLKTDVHTVLIVDSGDGNYDFTLNTEFDDGVDKQAGIIWLASTQGYTKEDVEAALNDGDYKDSKFLKSLAQEVANCTTSMNAITFLQDMELKDLVEREPGDVKVDTRTECGLFDPWNGAGGLFEIVLEKPVTVPKDFIQSYNVDGAFGSYGIGQVYGQWLG